MGESPNTMELEIGKHNATLLYFGLDINSGEGVECSTSKIRDNTLICFILAT